MDKTWAMYNEEAREMYLEEMKHHSAFSHCWKSVWDQPKWKRYISSLCSNKTRLSESGDCMSSSEDAPEIETGEQIACLRRRNRKQSCKNQVVQSCKNTFSAQAPGDLTKHDREEL
jgi:hypothetical protein